MCFLLAGHGAALWTIRQDDFHGTKRCLVRIWKPRTKTTLLNKRVRGSEWGGGHPCHQIKCDKQTSSSSSRSDVEGLRKTVSQFNYHGATVSLSSELSPEPSLLSKQMSPGSLEKQKHTWFKGKSWSQRTQKIREKLHQWVKRRNSQTTSRRLNGTIKVDVYYINGVWFV